MTGGVCEAFAIARVWFCGPSPGEIQVKSVNGGYLFSTDPLRYCRLLWCSGVASQLIGTPVADALDKPGLSV
ncbi:MAG: hypothetical protein C5S48_05565 [Candidatus Methanogaster sp.]|nr:MAG: hypothetical protein C5S48_05565 [ANME-2 cluster archaeon]